MENPSGEVLIEKSKAGDMTAFKALVVRYEGKVASVVRAMLGTQPEADDIGQEVFIRFYDSLNKLRGDSSVATYLLRIAINLSLHELKRRKKPTRFAFSGPTGNTNSDEDKMDLKEQLQYEFSRLDPEFQSVVTLRLIEGYSFEETADLVGIPVGTVLSRLARAQHKLRIVLSKKLK